MVSLDGAVVRDVAAKWIWAPADATEHVTEEYRLTHYLPDQSSVHWSRTDRPLGEVLDEVTGLARAAGSPRLEWWVDEQTRPLDTADRLAALGLVLRQTLEVLAIPLGAEVGSPSDVTIREVTDREGLALASRVSAEVFGIAPASEAQIDREVELASVPTMRRTVRKYIAWVDEAPVASAGATVDGPAVRLWDGAVAPEHRGRGIYRALVARRLRDFRDTSADFALVKAVSTTSAPILRRLGFTAYGEQRCWSLPLAR
ncbi:GNAT family N-acetyltransferase [Nocardioides euryhalodurans]|uniref:GNAT family N-acetyltransferase n=1 Tax=Nocardioides euryhalodurans TaxID=2518370 RepID=A0A4P7GJ89_9ACTN|nr:GNAT family N-acetyltransferase [Nocardioides euryhalodurans]QBR92070.1 GNAT family N-acetyltransferase [Nocardioides euryhalodurans]